MATDVIVALDFPTAQQTLEFLDKFGSVKPFVKIGMELYYAEGPEIVRQIKARGHKVFLDLKLHDIPNTVFKAMRVLSSLTPFSIGSCCVSISTIGAIMFLYIVGLLFLMYCMYLYVLFANSVIHR